MRVRLDQLPPTLDHVWEVATRGSLVEVAPEVLGRLDQAAAFVEALVHREEAVYGITTGFGKLASRRISPSDTARLQRNLIVSHACGVGEPLPAEVVRAAMFLRLATLSRGHSGVRVPTFELLRALLNHRIHPVVPAQGSVGASGDLAPLSHMALALLGLGEVEFQGRRMKARAALKKVGLAPVELAAKEGLALNNGTQIMTALGALTLVRARALARVADVAAALCVEALHGFAHAYDARLHALRPHPGQGEVAAHLRALLAGSALVNFPGQARVGAREVPQDSYSLRCVPQIHGATRAALAYVEGALTHELAAVTDNPVLFPEDQDVLSGGNFHGQPVAMALDHLKLALTNLGNVSERRTAKLVDPSQNEGLGAFLIGGGKAGLHSGLMIPQYVAAALTSENKVLSHPASADTVPTSANTEDHVSMGPIAGRQARAICANLTHILSVELLCAAQAVDLRLRKVGRGPEALGRGTRAAYQLIRQQVRTLTADRDLAPDLAALHGLIDSGELLLATSRALD